ncbi:MAG: hypothetical protein IPJ92_08420 [Veillonella sp.]|nr:hypothetical protein [Veillonella sp.]
MPSEGGNTVGGIAIGLNAAAKDGSISIGQQVQTGSTNIDRANQRGVTSVGDWTTVSAESIKAVGANGELGSVGALGSGNKADYALFSTRRPPPVSHNRLHD